MGDFYHNGRKKSAKKLILEVSFKAVKGLGAVSAILILELSAYKELCAAIKKQRDSSKERQIN
jgi:hypothetical protein